MEGLQEPIEGWFAAFQLFGQRRGEARREDDNFPTISDKGARNFFDCPALCRPLRFPTVVKTLPLSSSITAVKQARGGPPTSLPPCPELNWIRSPLSHKRAELIFSFKFRNWCLELNLLLVPQMSVQLDVLVYLLAWNCYSVHNTPYLCSVAAWLSAFWAMHGRAARMMQHKW